MSSFAAVMHGVRRSSGSREEEVFWEFLVVIRAVEQLISMVMKTYKTLKVDGRERSYRGRDAADTLALSHAKPRIRISTEWRFSRAGPGPSYSL